MKLNVKAFALACGLLWGIGLFIATWWIILLDGCSEHVTFIGKVYRGYEFTALGSVFGLIWALIDGFIAGVIFAWVYNKIVGTPRTPAV
ncbi:MAG: bacteriophage holin [Candidatus Zixiibacteriota bacterium]